MHIQKNKHKTDIKINKNDLEIIPNISTPEEDLEFLKETEEALKLHDEGKVKRMNADAFLKELRKW